MYFIFVSNDSEAVRQFETVLKSVDRDKLLITVPNGFDLIRFLQDVKRGESYPDLIVLNPKFLRLNGLDLLELLKTDDIYRLIPVIMLLPESDEVQEALCNRLFTEFLPSPTNQDEWEDAVNKMCTVCT